MLSRRLPASLGRVLALALALVAAVALAAAAGALASQPTKGAKYKGKTDEKTSASFRVAKSGKNIPTYLFYFSYHCNNGSHGPTGFGNGKGTKPIPVTKDGTFTLHETVQLGPAGERITFVISGAFAHAGKRASGHFSEHVRDSNGVTCKSGKVTFTVHRV